MSHLPADAHRVLNPQPGQPQADAVREAGSFTDFELRKLWRQAGGGFHGPRVETGTMPESKLLPFLRALATPSQPAQPAQAVPQFLWINIRALRSAMDADPASPLFEIPFAYHEKQADDDVRVMLAPQRGAA